MSDGYSSGASADKACKIKDSKCKDSKKHNWEEKGSWPSLWEQCKKCGAVIFWK